jgi:hypothetical protein
LYVTTNLRESHIDVFFSLSNREYRTSWVFVYYGEGARDEKWVSPEIFVGLRELSLIKISRLEELPPIKNSPHSKWPDPKGILWEDPVSSLWKHISFNHPNMWQSFNCPQKCHTSTDKFCLTCKADFECYILSVFACEAVLKMWRFK